MEPGEKLVVIEDDPDILEVLTYNLKREGYRVLSAMDGGEGLRMVRAEAPRLVILDVMLPGMDGIEVCRRLQEDPITRGTPILMLTAKQDESDVVLGLGVGADDYVTKPFRIKELMARVKAILRRGPIREGGAEADRLVIDDLIVDIVSHQVYVKGEEIDLTATEFRLLKFLAGNPGRVFSRDQLMSRVIRGDAIVTERNIDVHIRSLRKKIGRDREWVETIRGVGYRFIDKS